MRRMLAQLILLFLSRVPALHTYETQQSVQRIVFINNRPYLSGFNEIFGT